MKIIVVTGGAGFIGSNLINYIMTTTRKNLLIERFWSYHDVCLGSTRAYVTVTTAARAKCDIHFATSLGAMVQHVENHARNGYAKIGVIKSSINTPMYASFLLRINGGLLDCFNAALIPAIKPCAAASS